jgi:hypothetical protein
MGPIETISWSWLKVIGWQPNPKMQYLHMGTYENHLVLVESN